MNPTKKMTMLAFGLLLAGVGFAQTANDSSPGLLGQRYAELGLARHELKFSGDHAYSLGGGVNLPAVPTLLDVSLGYSHQWMRGARRGHSDIFSAMPIAYAPLKEVKPFVGLGMGWQTAGFGYEPRGLWGAVAGIEFGSGNFTFTPRINYVDDFEVSRVSVQQWSWAVEGNCWLAPRTGIFASVGRSDVVRNPGRSWDYQIGLRVKF